MIIFFLGYGLVELPRYLWNKSERKKYMQYLFFKISKTDEKLSSLKSQLSALLGIINKIIVEPDLRPHLQTIQDKVKAFSMTQERETFAVDPDRRIEKEFDTEDMDYKTLAKLHRKFNLASDDFNRTLFVYHQWIRRCVWLEDVLKATGSQERVIHSHFYKSGSSSTLCKPLLRLCSEWYWYTQGQ